MGEHMLFKTGIRRLGSKEQGFFYRYPEGGMVREERVLTRIDNLKVPPAWRDARIARAPSAKVQAVGYDSAERLQYLYSQRYRDKKEREKFDRILRFADTLPQMRKTTSEHLRHERLDREKVLATMIRLINAAYFRVGDERYARQNKTYGIATLRRKHLAIDGELMVFEYRGKWGQMQRKCVADAQLARSSRSARRSQDTRSLSTTPRARQLQGRQYPRPQLYVRRSWTRSSAPKLQDLGGYLDRRAQARRDSEHQ
jgi:DNA topoisomerase IB